MHRLGVMAVQRLRRQGGFGLIELLIAMTILVIGIMGIVAAFSAGAVSLQRASRISNAATVADAQMEGYRAMALLGDRARQRGHGRRRAGCHDSDDGAVHDRHCLRSGAGGLRRGEPGHRRNGDLRRASQVHAAAHAACPSRMQGGADGITYRVDVYIKLSCPLGGTPPRVHRLAGNQDRGGRSP